MAAVSVWTCPKRSAAWATIGFGSYLFLAHATFGNRAEQFVLCGLMLTACALGNRGRQVFKGFLPFIGLGMVYDCLRLILPTLSANSVAVAAPYLIDRALFGVGWPGARMTLNEFFARHHAAPVDFVCGLAYMTYIYIAMGLAMCLALSRRRQHHLLLARYGWCFFAVSVAGFATYYLLPAAPPWYVASHGLGPADLTTRPDPAALTRWDAMTGLSYFRNFYARSSDVFGAMPSLHCAYPLVAFLYARLLRRPRLSAAMFGFYLLVCFSAVYLQHHYVIDVLVGSLYAWGGHRMELFLTSRDTSRDRTDSAASASAAGPPARDLAT